jgi:hypothetical protein
MRPTIVDPSMFVYQTLVLQGIRSIPARWSSAVKIVTVEVERKIIQLPTFRIFVNFRQFKLLECSLSGRLLIHRLLRSKTEE